VRLRREYLIVLLVVVAAYVAVAASRTSAPTEPNGVVVPVNSARLTAVLAKLAPPTGFRRGRCIPASQGDTVCFRRPRSIVLSSSVMGGFVASFGAKLDAQIDRSFAQTAPQNAPTPANCHPKHGYEIQRTATPTLRLIACNVVVLRDSQELNIVVTSLVLADSRSIRSSNRAAFGVPSGTEIAVTGW
jgi:hypothetical protein